MVLKFNVVGAVRDAIRNAVAPPAILDALANAEAEDMASLRKERTGVDNTIFVSTKGYAQHAPRIKIAVDPPHSLNATSKTASMAIHNYSITGEHPPSHVVEQAKQFIERNREALLLYWNCEIDTDQLVKRLVV
jgi:hypothetical protein